MPEKKHTFWELYSIFYLHNHLFLKCQEMGEICAEREAGGWGLQM